MQDQTNNTDSSSTTAVAAHQEGEFYPKIESYLTDILQVHKRAIIVRERTIGKGIRLCTIKLP